VPLVRDEIGKMLRGQRKPMAAGQSDSRLPMEFSAAESGFLAGLVQQLFLFFLRCPLNDRHSVVAAVRERLQLPPAFARQTITNILDGKMFMAAAVFQHYRDALAASMPRGDRDSTAQAIVIFAEDVIESILANVRPEEGKEKPKKEKKRKKERKEGGRGG
jgi:hypothetical protein